ncbi:hypothetical protein [Cellulomonas sp. Marseille-Q8402]
MNLKSTSTWIAGTAFVALGILALTWFFAVSPTLDSASDAQTQTVDELARADLLEIQVAQLAKQFAEIDTLRGELADVRTKVPATADLSGFTRELQELASAAGVTVTGLAPSSPQAFVSAAATVDPASTADASATDAATTEGAAAADPSAAVAAATGTGVYAVPVSFTTLGSYDAGVAFLKGIQEQASRLVLVTGFTATSQTEQGAVSGRPATVRGDVELVANAYIYLLPDGTDLMADAVEEQGAALPVPSGQANPFAPVN